MKKNSKGFTLVELLAVIVVLAVIMVIATTQVNRTINTSRSNSFVESYQMIIRQVKTYIASGEDPSCDTDCLTKYDLSNDYTLTVTDATGAYTVSLGASTDGKFKNLNLQTYGDYFKEEVKTENGTSAKVKSCNVSKIASGATNCTANSITGSVSN